MVGYLEKCEPCSLTDMDFHSMPGVLKNIDDSIVIMYPPVTPLDSDSTSIKFIIPGNQDTYIDLGNLYIYLVVELKTGSNGDIGGTASAKIAPINNFLYSLFSTVEISINGKLVTQPNSSSPYAAYFTNLFNYGTDAKNGHLTNVMWYKDSAGKFNEVGISTGGNAGFYSRNQLSTSGKKFELYGKIISDITNQPKELINGCELTLVFHRARHSFNIMNLNDTPGVVKAVISVGGVSCRRTKPSVLKFNSDQDAIKLSPALYPLTKTDIKLFTIPANVNSKSLNQVVSGPIPTRITIGLTKNEGLVGSYALNPFNFEHHSVSSLSLSVGGRSYPSKPYNLDYASNNYMLAYSQLFSGLNTFHGDNGIDISYKDFKSGYCLYIFDLTAGQSASSEYIEDSKISDLNIDITFATAPTDVLTCVVYTETNALMTIDTNRDVNIVNIID